jgi:hypothetical protein
MTSIASPRPAPSLAAHARAAAVPWVVYAVLLAATSAVVGVIWDISWHRSIGRDTFWTPAHLLIYASGIIAGLSCGSLVLRRTFAGTPEAKAAGVSFWGFRGPLGAWLCIWGAFAMIVSAPFDDWWHNAYGLDVKVLSPPHVVLALGFTAIQLGALLMTVAYQNRAERGDHRRYGLLATYGLGILLCNVYIMGFEYIAFPNDMHKAAFYQVTAVVFPAILAACARGARLPWPATTAAAIYMGIHVAMILILPLFPAQPMLAPIYNPVTHMVPPPFPILLVLPALAVDLLERRLRTNDWLRAGAVGLAFVAVLFVAQWYFSMFLISPASENVLFGVQRWNYNNRLGPWIHEFWDPGQDPVTVAGLAIAVALAALSARLGFAWGNWLARVRR